MKIKGVCVSLLTTSFLFFGYIVVFLSLLLVISLSRYISLFVYPSTCLGRASNGSTVHFESGSHRVASDWTPGKPLALMNVDGIDIALKVEKCTSGFRIRFRGADMRVTVRSPRQAELAKLMIEKVVPDTSKLLLCPMPGLIVKVDVAVGDEVQEGQTLCTVEAMKMENILRAEKKAIVSKIHAAPGDSLAVDAIIMEFE